MATVFRLEATQTAGSLDLISDVSGGGVDFVPGAKPVVAHQDAGSPLIVLPIDHDGDQDFGSHFTNDTVPVSLADGITIAIVFNNPTNRWSRNIGPPSGVGRRTLFTAGQGAEQLRVEFNERLTDPRLGTIAVQGPFGTAEQNSTNHMRIANVLIITADETGGIICLNGVKTPWTWAANGAAETGVRFGTDFAEATTATFQFREIEMQDERLSEADLTSLSQALIVKYGIPVDGPGVQVTGDSIAALHDDYTSSNALIRSGIHLDRPTTSWATEGNNLFNGQRTLFDNYGPTLIEGDILLIQAGSNDIAGGQTAAQMATDETDFIDNRVRGVVDQVVDMTILPRTDFDDLQEATRLEVNAARIARTDTTTIDIASRPEFQDPTDRRYFSEDGVHLTDLGQQIKGDMIAAQFSLSSPDQEPETNTSRPWTPDDLLVAPLVDIRASNFANNPVSFTAEGAVAVSGDGINFADGAYLDLGADFTGAHIVTILGPLAGGSANFLNSLFGSSFGGANNESGTTDSESSFVNFDNAGANFLLSVNGTNGVGLGAVARINGEAAPFDNDPIFPTSPYVQRTPFGVDSYSIQYASDSKVNTRFVNALVTSATAKSTNNALTVYGFFIFAEPLATDEIELLEAWAQYTFEGNSNRLIDGHTYKAAAPSIEVPLEGTELLLAEIANLRTAVAAIPTDTASMQSVTDLAASAGGTTPDSFVDALLGTDDNPSPENSPLLSLIERSGGKLAGLETEVSKIERSATPVEPGGIVNKNLHDTDGNITDTIRENTV